MVAGSPAADAAMPTVAIVLAGAGEPPGADAIGQTVPVKFHDELLRTLPQHAMRPPFLCTRSSLANSNAAAAARAARLAAAGKAQTHR